MTTLTPTERAVREVRHAAYELNATDQQQAVRMLNEALKLQPGHADLLADLAALHLQAGRHRQCIQAAAEALVANPQHDDSAFALALSCEAVGETARALALYRELAEGERAERFAASQPELVAMCRAKIAQLAAAPAAPVAAGPVERATTASPAPAPVPAPLPAAVAAPAAPGAPSGRIYAPLLVRPDGLGTLLDETEGIEALSLDCFDTILWRHVEQPVDVFFDLQTRPAFVAAGIDARMRHRGESHARQLQFVRAGRTEVSIEQIYLGAKPGLSREMLAWLAEDELAAEMKACHAHPGAVRLLRAARARGLPVTVVSDTYFDAARLRRLLAHALPADAMAAIGRIIVSSEHGFSKEQGLFRLAQLNEHPNSPALLHVGDNKKADFEAPRALGMSATHLMQEDADGHQRRRMGTMAISLLDPAVRTARPLHTPYRVVQATHAQKAASAPAKIGRAALGPLMHAFATWIEREADELAATHPRVKLVFLMRDAHLPLQAYQAIGGRHPACALRISRFGAYAASFQGQEQVDHYLAHFGSGLPLAMIARQLLLSPQRAQALVDEAEASSNPRQTFMRGVRQAHVLAEIVAASTAYRERLHRYLRAEAGLEPGDTLMLVDLGYAGTIQRVLAPVMRHHWQVQATGRYLLAVGTVDADFKGLLDERWLDDRALRLMQTYIGLLETLCSTSEPSTVDYDDEGRPLHEDGGVEDDQSRLVEPIQRECVGFVRDAQAYFDATRQSPPIEALRDDAFACLSRMTFFPTPVELDHLAGFSLEINLGSNAACALFDVEAGLDGLRKHGLFYALQARGADRMVVPAELRAAGMDQSITLLAHGRYALPMNQHDWSTRREPLLALVTREGSSVNAEIDALPTHDGYFAAIVPMVAGVQAVGLAFGRDHQWIQLHSVHIVPLGKKHYAPVDVLAQLVGGGVKDHGHGLLEFEAPDSLLMLDSPALEEGTRAGLRVVFRPIGRRAPTPAAATA